MQMVTGSDETKVLSVKEKRRYGYSRSAGTESYGYYYFDQGHLYSAMRAPIPGISVRIVGIRALVLGVHAGAVLDWRSSDKVRDRDRAPSRREVHPTAGGHALGLRTDMPTGEVPAEEKRRPVPAHLWAIPGADSAGGEAQGQLGTVTLPELSSNVEYEGRSGGPRRAWLPAATVTRTDPPSG